MTTKITLKTLTASTSTTYNPKSCCKEEVQELLEKLACEVNDAYLIDSEIVEHFECEEGRNFMVLRVKMHL